ncbi:uncharacterized protein RHO25_011611 [Cercospora beticola]|uniref:Zn(2)-C6 fungal-type domain-containing protein n=2 Tax=Cercospora beticola TaxID=122368 RepID=A0ABZ0P5G4_CERBT|nr:hypothetical protein RHO25_011611 [Cercospora beticola]
MSCTGVCQTDFSRGSDINEANDSFQKNETDNQREEAILDPAASSAVKMPRLNHKKARTGCQRCKARKVKCDEGKPKCIACMRHNVVCEYVDPQPRRSDGQQSAQHNSTFPPYSAPGNPPNDFFNHNMANELTLELRLMRQWTIETCETFTADKDFWQKQATELGLTHRMILDAMFSLSALHISWQSLPDVARSPNATSVGTAVRREMIINAQKYLQRALDGHTAAMSTLNKENAKAVYTASVLLLHYSFLNLGEIAYEPTLPGYDHTFWTRLSGHTHYLCDNWAAMEGGEQSMNEFGVFFGRPNLGEADQLFSQEQGKPFTELLTFAEEYDNSSTDDKAIYQNSVAYLAWIHKSIANDTEPALLNCQRLVAMPSQLGRRFTELVEHRQPRALLILAHILATTKLLAKQLPWLREIAERQIPPLQQLIPPAWQEMMKWPMEITFGPQQPETIPNDQRNGYAFRDAAELVSGNKDQTTPS